MESILVNFIQNLDLVKQQLKDGQCNREPDKDFQLHTFWLKLEGIVKVLSHEATKMAISFSQPPLPSTKDCEILIAGIEKAALGLVSVFYSLPQHFGTCLAKSTKQAVVNVIEEVHGLVSMIQSLCGKEEKMNLTTTGSVWQACDEVANIPKDNKQVVLVIIKNNFELVKDALEEMKEALKDEGGGDMVIDEEDDDQDETWTEDDRALISPCLALVTASKAFLKKSATALSSNGQCDALDYLSQMDTLACYVEQISPEVDVLVSGLYAPLQHSVVKTNAVSLAELSKQSLDYFRSTHMCTEVEVEWVEFLLKAIDHNLAKIDTLVK
ncbi:cyclin-D1-binding protein 1 homolog [Lineus longissimus]|uniref:cyclin-D1-binding protein 1 homolog n=1 Tax=Lineus longissimus TaxID=88925 RepID=UPI002B4DE285